MPKNDAKSSRLEPQLANLVAAVRACRICRDQPSGPPLPHEPNPVLQVSPRARVLIAGQAPGTKVHGSGRPFTDRSGDRLRQWLGIGEDIFYDPTRVAIMAMGFCFPGQDARGADLPPRRECAPVWRPQLLANLKKIELILAIGLYAQRWHLGGTRELTGTVRDWRSGLTRDIPVIPLPHPSWRNNGWLRKNPWFEAELVPELQARIRRLVA